MDEEVERILYALVSIDVFKLNGLNSKGEMTFVNSALSAVLRRDHPNSAAGGLVR